MPTIPQIKIIESSFVAPQPGIVSGHASVPLTFFDVFWIHHPHPSVERLFLYPYSGSTSHFYTSLLSSLKSSLSLALEKFYPLAGNLRLTPGTDDKFEICYTDSSSVPFTVAECDGKFEEFSGYHEREISQFQNFIPQLPKSDKLQPLFSVQVTVFPEQGIVIGTAIHHAACDGISSMQFMHEWAATCSSKTRTIFKGPIIDRTLMPDPSNLSSKFHHELQEMSGKAGNSKPVAASPPKLMLATFTLSQGHIRKLKQLIINNMKERNVTFHCSTFVVAVAYVAVCYVQATNLDKSKRVCFGLPADYRARIEPPLPAEYFGNCVWFVAAVVEVSDLIRDNGVDLAAEAIGRGIEQLSDGLKGAENCLEPIKHSSGVPVVGAAGSPKLKVYGLDFGWGKPKKVEVISATKTGSISLAESRDESGGIEIGLVLSKSEMDCFKKYFENGLEKLPC